MYFSMVHSMNETWCMCGRDKVERRDNAAQSTLREHGHRSPVLRAGPCERHCARSDTATRTLTKPMALLFSRKHWRQRSRPYLRMRPAWCAQRRLGACVSDARWQHTRAHHWREPLPYLRGRENQTASCVILSRGAAWRSGEACVGVSGRTARRMLAARTFVDEDVSEF